MLCTWYSRPTIITPTAMVLNMTTMLLLLLLLLSPVGSTFIPVDTMHSKLFTTHGDTTLKGKDAVIQNSIITARHLTYGIYSFLRLAKYDIRVASHIAYRTLRYIVWSSNIRMTRCYRPHRSAITLLSICNTHYPTVHRMSDELGYQLYVAVVSEARTENSQERDAPLQGALCMDVYVLLFFNRVCLCATRARTL